VGLSWASEPFAGPFVTAAIACALLAVAATATGDLADAGIDEVWPFLAIGAAVPGLSQILFVLAVRDAGPSRAAVLIGTAPVIAAVIAVAFLDEPLGPTLAIATFLIVIGGALLAFEGRRPAEFKAIGAVLALTCALLFALRDNLVRAVARSEDVPPLAAATASLAGATVALLLVLLLVRRGRGFTHGLPRTVRAFFRPGSSSQGSTRPCSRPSIAGT
jgi:drug/metabolite transporter (DMT)-like permease